jgi:hypothetical protein
MGRAGGASGYEECAAGVRGQGLSLGLGRCRVPGARWVVFDWGEGRMGGRLMWLVGENDGEGVGWVPSLR